MFIFVFLGISLFVSSALLMMGFVMMAVSYSEIIRNPSGNSWNSQWGGVGSDTDFFVLGCIVAIMAAGFVAAILRLGLRPRRTSISARRTSKSLIEPK